MLATTLITGACTSSATPAPTSTTQAARATATHASTSAATPSPAAAPTHYTVRVLFHGAAHPDDLAFDNQGRLLFSDVEGGTVNRVDTGGSLTVLLRGIAGPEGIVVLPDGTMFIAEQQTNRILRLDPGAASPVPIHTLPCPRTGTTCAALGVDNIALAPASRTLIIPDSPTGEVYRMSFDGRAFILLASGITRPVGAIVDSSGALYVPDEFGGALWRIAPDGSSKTRIGGFGEPDDVSLDPQGNLLVIDLAGSVHALIRLDPRTGARRTLSSDFTGPQGLVVDAHGDIYVADETAGRIVELLPA
jgi:sugar lactone lactonase YvrE